MRPSRPPRSSTWPYRAAFDKAKSIEELFPYMSAPRRKEVETTPKDERAKMFEMFKAMATVTRGGKVTKEARSPDGGATLTVEGIDPESKTKETGTVEVIKEGGAWKIGKESWRS